MRLQVGETPTCAFPLFSATPKIHPFVALFDDGGISPPAGGDQRPTALDPCRLLKKAGENFIIDLVSDIDTERISQ